MMAENIRNGKMATMHFGPRDEPILVEEFSLEEG